MKIVVRAEGTISPKEQRLSPGQPLILTASVIGDPAPTIQWQHKERDIPGATGLTYHVPKVTAADAGYLRWGIFHFRKPTTA